MPALVAGIHEFVTSSRQDVDGRDKPGHDGTERQTLELVGQADQSQLQRVAEIASVGKGNAIVEIRSTAGSNVRLAEIDIAEFRARGPVPGEHVLDADTRSPADLGLILGEGSNLPRIQNPVRIRPALFLTCPTAAPPVT